MALVAAAVARSRRLAAVAVVGCVLAAALLWPERPGSVRAVTATGPDLRVATVNVLFNNDELARALREVASWEPDVVALHELQPRHLAAVDASPLARLLPHRSRYEDGGFHGELILSRHPVTARRTHEIGTWRMPSVELDVAGRAVEVVGVHTTAPAHRLGPLRTELRQLGAIAADRSDGAPPLVLAGDFNASHEHRLFRDLLDGPLVDAHLARGRGLDRSWPTRSRLPPFVLIDRVVVTEDIGIIGVSTPKVPGSDHRAAVADLRLP